MATEVFVRSHIDSQNIDGKYIVKKSGKFARQFGHLYYNRLTKLSAGLKARAVEKWGDELYVCDNVTDKKPNVRDCVMFGTFYKDMKKKPRALDRYLDEPPEDRETSPEASLMSSDDVLVLEDCEGRLEMKGNENDLSQFVTGTVIAVKGRFVRGGFLIQETCMPGIPRQPSLPKDNNCNIVLVSGLSLGSGSDFLTLQLLADYLSGYLGSQKDCNMNSRIARVIIAGNSFAQTPDEESQEISSTTANLFGSTVLEQFDMFLTQLVSSVCVDLMGGRTDPTNFTFPQQPLHKCLFPMAETYNTLKLVTNPYKSTLNGVGVLGSSGQNVDDIRRQSSFSTLECLEKSLKWRITCPTAPDTLPSYPFKQKDPYLIEECPHIYFVGNQEKYETKLMREGSKSVRLISVPDFSKTGSVVTVNLETLDCNEINFKSL